MPHLAIEYSSNLESALDLSAFCDCLRQTAVEIDKEVRDIVERAYNKALELLRENIDKLHLLAKTLLEREVLDGDQMDRLLKGEELDPITEPPKDDDEAKTEEKPVAEEPEPKQGEGPFDALGPAPRPAGA